jgi:hypothetical protein
LLLEDITLRKQEQITAEVRFKGGATRTLTLPIPLKSWQLTQADRVVVESVDRLLDQHTDGEIGAILNQRGLRPKKAAAFTGRIVRALRCSYGLTDRYTRLRRRGLLTIREIAAQLEICVHTARQWQHDGLLTSHAYDDHGGRLFEPPVTPLPKWQWQRTRRKRQFLPTRHTEVQSDA